MRDSIVMTPSASTRTRPASSESSVRVVNDCRLDGARAEHHHAEPDERATTTAASTGSTGPRAATRSDFPVRHDARSTEVFHRLRKTVPTVGVARNIEARASRRKQRIGVAGFASSGRAPRSCRRVRDGHGARDRRVDAKPPR